MFQTFLTTALTVLLTVVLTANIAACVVYRYLVRPARQYARSAASLEAQLFDERTLRGDLIAWIGRECRTHEAPGVEAALKQRIKERLDLFEQGQQRRQERTRKSL